MPGGGSESWAPFALCCWVMFPGCAVAAWHEAEQPQPTFDPRLRLGQKHSTWESLAAPGTTYMPQHVPASDWTEIQVCTVPLQGQDFHGKAMEPMGQRGPELYLTPFPLQSPGTPGHGSSDIASAPHFLQTQEIKIVFYLSQAWFLQSESQQAKLHTSVIHILL